MLCTRWNILKIFQYLESIGWWVFEQLLESRTLVSLDPVDGSRQSKCFHDENQESDRVHTGPGKYNSLPSGNRPGNGIWTDRGNPLMVDKMVMLYWNHFLPVRKHRNCTLRSRPHYDRSWSIMIHIQSWIRYDYTIMNSLWFITRQLLDTDLLYINFRSGVSYCENLGFLCRHKLFSLEQKISVEHSFVISP